MLTSFAGNPPMNIGEVYEVSKESAELLIKRGQAELAPSAKSSGKSNAVSKNRRSKKTT